MGDKKLREVSECYYFNEKELKALLCLFSKVKVPSGLEGFYSFVNKYGYQHLTIEEAEKLFK